MFFCRKVAPLFVLFPSPLAVYFVLDFTTAGCWLQSTPAFFSRTCELENYYCAYMYYTNGQAYQNTCNAGYYAICETENVKQE